MIATPCVGVCVIDSQSALCKGCGRTTQEIAQWTSFTVSERQQIMQQLEARHGSHIGNQRRIS